MVVNSKPGLNVTDTPGFAFDFRHDDTDKRPVRSHQPQLVGWTLNPQMHIHIAVVSTPGFRF